MVDKAQNMGAKAMARKAVGLALKSKTQTTRKHLSHLTSREAVEYAMRPMDVSGAPPTEEHLVRFDTIWNAVRNHPTLPRNFSTKTSKAVRRRRKKDAVRRVIKANPRLKRQGATKGARYFYDSSLASEKLKLLTPIVLGEIMRTPFINEINFEDLCQRLSYTDPANVADALSNMEENAAIDGYLGEGTSTTGDEKIRLKPGIWKYHPFGKETYNFTLSEHTSDIFADLALNMFYLQAEFDNASPGDELSENQSKWFDMFGATAPPEGMISKSLIVEVALWNLYHSLPRMARARSTAPDVLRDAPLQTVSVEAVMDGGEFTNTEIEAVGAALSVNQSVDKTLAEEGEPLSEIDQSGGVDQSALKALADDKDFKDLVAKLTLTYLKERKD